MKRVICLCCAVFLLSFNLVGYANPQIQTSAKSVLLMEQSTKEILYENNPDEQLAIASVTKIMTMLLIMEALDEGKISMEDMVPVSERAMSMGGSTMFLEAGEELSVYEMLKGIAVASANDGCVAMAEFISGSVETFVAEMNKRAQELGMKNTNFVNTNGLDAEGHYSSARDVALMSAELLKHEKIFEFTTIWTDKMHDGKFDLSNTNKLIRFYSGANGLKTGSTDKALCCLSATAKRDDLQLIAVVLGAPTSNDRFNDARTLLDYGFANYDVEKFATKEDKFLTVPVRKGVKENVSVVAKDDVSLLVPKGNKGKCEKEIFVPDKLSAPIKKGSSIGKVIYTMNGEKVSEVELVAGEDVEKVSFTKHFIDIIMRIFG